jgi:hypothetical protein
MPKPKRYELAPSKLRKITSIASLGFETTAQIGCLEGLIGQQRAVEAMEFGLDVASKGYNTLSSETTEAVEQPIRWISSGRGQTRCPARKIGSTSTISRMQGNLWRSAWHQAWAKNCPIA